MKNSLRLYTALSIILALSLTPSMSAQNGQELCGPTRQIKVESIPVLDRLPALDAATPEPMREIVASGSFTIGMTRATAGAHTAVSRTHTRSASRSAAAALPAMATQATARAQTSPAPPPPPPLTTIPQAWFMEQITVTQISFPEIHHDHRSQHNRAQLHRRKLLRM